MNLLQNFEMEVGENSWKSPIKLSDKMWKVEKKIFIKTRWRIVNRVRNSHENLTNNWIVHELRVIKFDVTRTHRCTLESAQPKFGFHRKFRPWIVSGELDTKKLQYFFGFWNLKLCDTSSQAWEIQKKVIGRPCWNCSSSLRDWNS